MTHSPPDDEHTSACRSSNSRVKLTGFAGSLRASR